MVTMTPDYPIAGFPGQGRKETAYNQAMLSFLFAALPFTQTGGAAPPRLELRLREAIVASGAEVAVAYRTLDGRDEVSIEPDKIFHAASTMKVPVMIELFNQARAGTLSLADPLPIKNEFHSIVDGSSYSLSEGDDSDREMYATVGKTLTLRQLCDAMITVSSNFAANLLIQKLGVDNIRRTVTRLGADANGGMQVVRGVEDGKAFEKGLINSTTARGLLTLFDKLARGEAVDAQSDAAMIEILKRQQFKDAIPAGLPPGIPVAHKTGNITRIHHDAGIVYGPRPYVLVLLVRGIEDRKKSGALMAELSKLVYESALQTK
jgi:beta-lactamase class A